MKPLVTFPDPQRLVVDYLTAALAARSESAGVGADLPGDWSPRSPSFVQVAHDGSLDEYPTLSRATVRVTTWSGAPTEGKSLVGVCRGLLLAHPGGDGVASVQSLTGVLPARDPSTRGYLASVTVQVNLRPIDL